MEDFAKRFGGDQYNAINQNGTIFKGNKYRITVLSELLVRLEYSETGNFEDRPTEFARFRNFELPKMAVDSTEKKLIIKTKYFELIYEKEKPFIGSKLSPDQYLQIKLLETNKLWYFNQAEARNFKSTCSNLDDADAMPKLEKGLYSTDGFVSIDDSKSLIINEDGSVGKRPDTRIDTYVFMYKKDFGYCLKDYYKLTGYPPLLPRYALGIWWNKDEIYSHENIIEILTKFKKHGLPLSIMLMNKWSVTDVSFNTKLIPNPNELISKLHDENIKLGLNLKLEKVPAHINGQRQDIAFNVFDKKFMELYFDTFVKPLNQIGADFYSIDYRGKDMYTLRMMNYYFFNYLKNEPNKRGLILSRNGLINAHLYPICNSGETPVDWKVLKFLPQFNSSSSNIGVSWWSHAIGGFKNGVEESELYTRYIQFATYSPIFRLASKKGNYYKREPWKWDVKTLKIAKDYMNLRHKLIPYLYSESYKYAKTGLPLLQPLYYRYPEIYDEPLYKNEYYFGTELFIAPITEKKDPIMNRSVIKLFLPNGMWYDFKTGKKFPGGKRYISFYKDEDYPVFAKQGAIIPLGILDEDNLSNTNNPSKLEVHIFPGKNNNYKLYEDDGISEAYKNGTYLISTIDYNYLPNNYTVIIRPTEGDTSVIPDLRSYKIRFRNTREANEVIAYIGDQPLDVKTYLDDEDFVVETTMVSSKAQLSINCKGKDIEIDAVRIINDDIETIIQDLNISTNMKEKIAEIMFSNEDIKKKRIKIRKLKSFGLNDVFIKMFLKLLEYVSEF